MSLALSFVNMSSNVMVMIIYINQPSTILRDPDATRMHVCYGFRVPPIHSSFPDDIRSYVVCEECV